MHPPATQQMKGAYALISLGCPKNLVDSERMAGLLGLDGYRMVAEPEGADFVVINTCGFIGDARDESHAVIREMLQLKRQGRLGGVIVAGCLAQRDGKDLLARHPDIDQLVGVFARDQIGVAAGRLFINGGCAALPADDRRILFQPAPMRPLEDTRRLRITPRHLAFLKIAEGCNRLCSFCTIPGIRGAYASKPIEQVAERGRGTGRRRREGIDPRRPGHELLWHRPLRPAAAGELLRAAGGDRRPGLDSPDVSLSAAHRRRVDRRDRRRAKKCCRTSTCLCSTSTTTVLARMRRRVTREETERLLDRLRERIPGLVLRTTLIAGFPGETERAIRDAAGVRSAAAVRAAGGVCLQRGAGHAGGRVGRPRCRTRSRLARRDAILAAQQEIAFAWSEAQVGRTVDVLIDRAAGRPAGRLPGRT